MLDGGIGRWRQKCSTMGRKPDSLADVISFGMEPALIAYSCGMRGFYDRTMLAYFVACEVSRLTRYMVTAEAMQDGTGNVKHFEGAPNPASIVLVTMMAVAVWFGALRQDLCLVDGSSPGSRSTLWCFYSRCRDRSCPAAARPQALGTLRPTRSGRTCWRRAPTPRKEAGMARSKGEARERHSGQLPYWSLRADTSVLRPESLVVPNQNGMTTTHPVVSDPSISRCTGPSDTAG